MPRHYWDMTREQTLWLALAAVAWLIESYDIGLTSVILLPFKHLFHLTAGDTGLLVLAPTLGIVAGVVPSGYIADRLGRKTLFAAAMTWYSAWTFAAGLATGWPSLALMRLAAGLGLGAMFPLPYTLLAELSPARMRGRVAGILDAFLSVGYFTAPMAGGWLAGTIGLARGWHWLFYVGGLGILYAAALSRWLPESPRWLAANGRRQEAAAILQRIGRELPDTLKTTARQRTSHPIKALFRHPYGQRTAMLWIAFPSILFLFYAIMNYMPTILAQEHLSTTIALNFSALIMAASIPGKLIEAWLVERIGRKPVIVGFSLAAAAAASIFPWVRGNVPLLVLGMALAFFGIAVDPAMKIYAAEQYPTVFRATGVGLAEGVARLFGGAMAPYIMAFLLALAGIGWSFAFVTAITVLGALTVAWLGTETATEPLADFAVESPPVELSPRREV